MKPDYTNARSAHGPTVVAWLKEQDPRLRSDLTKSDPFCATVASWDREDRLVGFYTLDRWLTPAGYFLCELPEDCWRWSTPKTRLDDREVCEQISTDYLAGKRRDELARAYGVRYNTVRNWTTGLRTAA